MIRNSANINSKELDFFPTNANSNWLENELIGPISASYRPNFFVTV